MVEQVKALTIEDFIRQYDQSPFEIINGRQIPLSPTTFGHSVLIKRIYDALLVFNLERKLGEVFAETVFILEERPDWVIGSRVPDVMFIHRDRMADYEQSMVDAKEKPLILVPDLAVEVISKNDSYSEVNEKIDAYLNDGVKLIWIVDSQRQRVTVYEPGKSAMTLAEKDILSGSVVVPGFEMALRELFK